ncbi:GAF and ANTAR domain-containing protein [Streptomyces sp. NPDC046716]|uniref:GAF and ANTAR domain-containing protein n=1 Tax=Streptomyces sp. NPDC046716 TaxID=3157093 RepID=UPI0033FB1DC8
MDWQDFAVRLASTARELLAEDSVDGTLDKVTHAALDLIEGCTAAGILLLRRGTAKTLAPTEQLVNDSDALQADLGEGPCFDAARTGHPVFRIKDLTEERVRWPAYAPRAQALGIGSMMGFLLYTEDEDLGALNLYSREPGAFTEVSETAGWALAAHAAVAFASAREHAQLEQAVASRHTIGEAMGILMAGHQLSERDAFDVLRRYSQEKNVKLREVAALVCERGDLHED